MATVNWTQTNTTNLANTNNKSHVDIDVYQNQSFKWTQMKSSDLAKAGIPYVKMTEYENKTDILLQTIAYLKRNRYTANSQTTIAQVAGRATTFNELYKGLYNVIPTGRTIQVPYLGKSPIHLETTYRQIDPNNNEYSNTLGKQISEMMGGIQNLWNKGLSDQWDSIKRELNEGRDVRSVAVDTKRAGTTVAKQAPKGYESSNYGEFSTTFNLINENLKLANNHYWFIRTLLNSQVPSYLDPMRLQVPYVYEISIPSLLHIPLGFISSFDAKPLGSAKMTDAGGKSRYTPEAWQITMSFNNLFPISYQMLQLLDSDNTAAEGFKSTNEANKQAIQTFRQSFRGYTQIPEG